MTTTRNEIRRVRRLRWLFVLLAALFAPSAVHASNTPSTVNTPRATIVEADWLQANLNNPKVRIIEVSTDPGVYEKGHIPNAVNLRWHIRESGEP
jgi:thiosulfate/3-mercaptopyruvate sulfurtransferase